MAVWGIQTALLTMPKALNENIASLLFNWKLVLSVYDLFLLNSFWNISGKLLLKMNTSTCATTQTGGRIWKGLIFLNQLNARLSLDSFEESEDSLEPLENVPLSSRQEYVVVSNPPTVQNQMDNVFIPGTFISFPPAPTTGRHSRSPRIKKLLHVLWRHTTG